MEIILMAVITLAVLGYHAYYVRESNKEKKDLVDALVSRSAQELRDLRLAGNTKIKVEPPKQPNMVDLSELDDKAFLAANERTYAE